ncbi:hypothetical protein [Mesorhizobium sp. CAU 1741]|uniref:hypothetical protein n=1 Tax=Mesorhizobium sp. CAU 1741 TaxID=3140366 RepID=UPI00325A75ED
MTHRHPQDLSARLGILCAILVLATGLLSASPALALSEIQREEVPLPPQEDTLGDEIEREDLPPPEMRPQPEESQSGPADEKPDMNVPFPDPVVIPKTPAKEEGAPVDSMQDDDIPVPEVIYDVETLPEPVRRMRTLIMEACMTGDIEQLRPLVGSGDNATQLSFANIGDDPIEFLRGLSGDDEGQEILAILYEVMAAGFVHLDQGAPGEMYVWPYFFAVPLETLGNTQRFELFKLVTAGDYEDMKAFGAYIFYRVGISPEGEWLFFVAGD